MFYHMAMLFCSQRSQQLLRFCRRVGAHVAWWWWAMSTKPWSPLLRGLGLTSNRRTFFNQNFGANVEVTNKEKKWKHSLKKEQKKYPKKSEPLLTPRDSFFSEPLVSDLPKQIAVNPVTEPARRRSERPSKEWSMDPLTPSFLGAQVLINP